MFRIDDPSASTQMPTPEAAGTPGYWTEGNPTTGVPATLERASWFNTVQEELMSIVLAANLTPSKTSYNQVLSAIQALTGGRLIGVRIFTPGTYVYNPTQGTSSIVVEVQGGGGAGGGAQATGSGQAAAGGGGSAGGYSLSRLMSGFSGVTITVGAGGTTAVAAQGGGGGSSSFGALLSATGGTGGTLGQALTPSSSPVLTGGANGGNGSGGNLVNSQGGIGRYSFVSAASTISGDGGSSKFGGGAYYASGTASGNPAGTPGAGGSGASLLANFAGGAQGGPGGAGVVIVWEYA